MTTETMTEFHHGPAGPPVRFRHHPPSHPAERGPNRNQRNHPPAPGIGSTAPEISDELSYTDHASELTNQSL